MARFTDDLSFEGVWIVGNHFPGDYRKRVAQNFTAAYVGHPGEFGGGADWSHRRKM